MTGGNGWVETREMKLITKVIQLSPGEVTDCVSLPEFIATHRNPGAGWRTWDEITIALHRITDQIVTDVSLRKWAARYGIPEDTRADGTGPTTPAVYARALKKGGITI